ncbi:MAG: hypothetical protein ABFS42_10490 [Candidatus Krumholzibacteriota bacterium]
MNSWKSAVLLLVPLLALTVMSCSEAPIALRAGGLVCHLDARGHLTSLENGSAGVEYLAQGQPAPLLSVKTAGRWITPTRLEPGADDSFSLHFDDAGVSVEFQALARETHLALEVLAVEPDTLVDALRWGPFPVAIGDTVGEIVGVVRNPEFAIGIQALNAKTIGGVMENEEGSILSRGTTAVKTDFGSTLNAFSLDRSHPRSLTVWNEGRERFFRMPVPPIPGETVVGSRIALFGCVPGSVLDVLGTIETTEGLPHPEIDGVWAKISPETGRSYLIAPFSEATVDTFLDAVERAGLMTLYHGDPFESWGHFRLRSDHFPNGRDGMRRCVEKATARDIRIGAHTLTAFITPDDPFVTPRPDPRLAETGRSYLTADIDADQTAIAIEDTFHFANERDNTLHCVRIGEELVRYGSVSRERPFRLLDCVRGAFGTTAASHGRGKPVGKLLDHPYEVFFPNFEMQDELVRNLADFFNETGISQMDFDGHEGCFATGQGDFAKEQFAERFHQLADHTVVNGSSRSSHYYWHVCHYLNWGEPWYEGFRESMQQYRIDNQALLERNYLPNMLGWYLLKPHTTLADIEWMLARAAGYDAGFALATSIAAIRGNPDLGNILDAIREWEDARRSGAFTPDQREGFRDPSREFHLQALPEAWRFHPIEGAGPFDHEGGPRASGMPAASTWRWRQEAPAGPLRFVLRTQGTAGAVGNPVLTIDHAHRLELPVRLEAGQSLACDGEPEVRVYDAKGRYIETVPLAAELPRLAPGTHEATFDCTFEGDPSPRASLSFSAVGRPERVPRPAGT